MLSLSEIDTKINNLETELKKLKNMRELHKNAMEKMNLKRAGTKKSKRRKSKRRKSKKRKSKR